MKRGKFLIQLYYTTNITTSVHHLSETMDVKVNGNFYQEYNAEIIL